MGGETEHKRYAPIQIGTDRQIYVTTLVGREGRVGDLELELSSSQQKVEGLYVFGSPTFSQEYHKVDKQTAEFDLYRRVSGNRRATNTQSFRRNFGELLTIMIQLGFNISAEDRSKEGEAIRYDF